MFTQFFHLWCLCSHSSSIPATNMFHMKFAMAMHEAMPGSRAANLCLEDWLRVGSCELGMQPKDYRYDDTTNKPTMWHIETKQLRHFLALCRICAGHCWTIRLSQALAKVWRQPPCRSNRFSCRWTSHSTSWIFLSWTADDDPGIHGRAPFIPFISGSSLQGTTVAINGKLLVDGDVLVDDLWWQMHLAQTVADLRHVQTRQGIMDSIYPI